MAEFATIMAGFGWYFLVRNGIRTVRQDFVLSQNEKVFWEGVEQNLAILDDQLKEWQKKWLLYDEVPDAIYLLFWGKDGFKKMKKLVGDASKAADELCKRIDDRKPQDPPSSAGNGQRNGLVSFIKRKARRAGQKISYVAFKSEEYNNLVNKLKENIGKIDCHANMYWKAEGGLKRDHRREVPDKNDIYHLAIKTNLSRFAVESRDKTDELFSSCESDDLRVHMALDILSLSSDEYPDSREFDKRLPTPSKHMKAIITASKLHMPELFILSSPDSNSGVVAVKEVSDNAAANPGGAAIPLVPVQEALKEAARGGRSLRFVIRRSSFEASYEEGIQEVLSFNAAREELGSLNYNSSERRTLKLKLAYELSIAYFMLYRSTWTEGVCLKSIWLVSLKMAELDNDSRSATRTRRAAGACGMEKSACSICKAASKLREMPTTGPLRRLGLLLVQIASNGANIDEATVNESKKCFSMLKIAGSKYTTGPSTLTIAEYIKKNLFDSDELSGAVEFCLTGDLQCNESPGNDVLEEILKLFYEKVVRV
jgi:hypothetical protein